MGSGKTMLKCMDCGIYRIFNFKSEKPVVVETFRRKYHGAYKIISKTRLLCPTCAEKYEDELEAKGNVNTTETACDKCK